MCQFIRIHAPNHESPKGREQHRYSRNLRTSFGRYLQKCSFVALHKRRGECMVLIPKLYPPTILGSADV